MQENSSYILVVRGTAALVGWHLVHIDRRSILGNPFLLEREQQRGDTVQAFREYLWLCHQSSCHQSPNDACIDPQPIANKYGLKISPKWKRPTALAIICALEQLLKRLIEGKKLLLSCHCAPLSCHGDIIKSYLLWRLHRFANQN